MVPVHKNSRPVLHTTIPPGPEGFRGTSGGAPGDLRGTLEEASEDSAGASGASGKVLGDSLDPGPCPLGVPRGAPR